MIESFELDETLIPFTSDKGKTDWTIRDAVEGVQIFGGIGSGKTSGSGRKLALSYLQKGFGGLVLTAKPDEKELWTAYCTSTNRIDDLIVIEPGGEHRFNFLEYESSGRHGGVSYTENIVQVLKTVIRSSEEKSGGKSDDPFWESALDMLMFNVIDLCLLAYGEVSVEAMYDIVQTAPQKDKPSEKKSRPGSFDHAYRLCQQKVNTQINDLFAGLSPEQMASCKEDANLYELVITESLPDAKLLKLIDQFFIEHYRNLSEKTRSIIEFSFAGFLFRLLKEPIYSLFCHGASTVIPEDSLDGKIILLNLPVKLYHKVGRDSQILFKYVWQRAMERRQNNDNARPVFLWADEAQNFLHEYDAEYQATARSSRIATVYISQNIPNYYANMGGHKSEYRVKSFLGTLATKIFHANADVETNTYASDLIGEAYAESVQRSRTLAGEFSSGETISFELQKMIQPREFNELKTGGPLNNNVTEAIMHLQGKVFENKQNHKKVSFKQN